MVAREMYPQLYGEDDVDSNKPTQDPQDFVARVQGISSSTAARVSGKDELERHIRRLRSRANQLEALYNILPAVLPPSEDEALWELLLNQR